MFNKCIAAAAFLICLSAPSVWAAAANFAVISDPHLYDTDLGTTGEAFETYLASDRKMLRESEAILASALKSIKAKKPDFLIVPGDLTKDGALASHEKFAGYLAAMEAAGIKVYVAPGNHDVNNPHAYSFDETGVTPVDTVSPEGFAQVYADFGYDEAIDRDEASLSYVAEPVEGIWIFSIDSCKYENNITQGSPETGGAIREDTMAWILEKMAEARSLGKQVIGFMHHGVTEHYTSQTAFFSEYVVDDWEQVSATLADAGMKMVFTGHYHANDITQTTRVNGGPTLFDVETGSLVTCPSPYRLVTLMDNKAAIQTQFVKKINYDTGDQSFQEYAQDYLYNGLVSIAQVLLQSMFGVDATTAAYAAPSVAKAFCAHYAGDETADAEAWAAINQFMGGDEDSQLLGGVLYYLWTDLPVADNNVFLDCSTGIKLSVAGTYAYTDASGAKVFDGGAAEILTYDPSTQRVFVSNAHANTVDVLDASDPAHLSRLFSIALEGYGKGVNSVAVKNGILAAAIEADPKQSDGKIVFFDTTTGDCLKQVDAGALPDMLTFTPDGRKVLCANEGEPSDDYTNDPEGSVTIVDLSGGVENADAVTVGFSAFNNQATALKEAGVRIFGPDATVAMDLEPEYIAVSQDGSTAWITCQENNAMAILDIETRTITGIVPLTYKAHNVDGNGLDASNKDDGINIQTYGNLYGMIQPDAVAAFQVDGETYLITANEGDSRDYDGFSEEKRITGVTLDPTAFPDAASLQENEVLGRLNITTTLGDTDEDGDYDELYCYGGRSFSIFKAVDGGLEPVFDSGDQLERITAAMLPDNFNATNDDNDSFDSRSDDKGPEPEGLAVGTINGRTYAFIGLERIGGVMVYDVTDPAAPVFVQYINNRDFTGDAEEGTAGDLGPEGLVFIPASDSPTGANLLGVANEISGTTTLYTIDVDSDLEGDFNGDGVVDNVDVKLLRVHLRQPAATLPAADFDGDGTITVRDVRKLINKCTHARCACQG